MSYVPMPDPVIYLTLEGVLALIKLATSLLERSASKESEFTTNLSIVKVDLGIINDVLKVTQRRNLFWRRFWRRNQENLPNGIKTWKEEAESVVRDTQKLLERIDKKSDQNAETDDPGMTNCWLCCKKTAVSYSKEDEQDLKKLKKRLDNITKHNDTVVALLRKSRCIPL